MDAWDDAWVPTHLGGRQVEEDEHTARSKGVVHVQKPNGKSSDGTCYTGVWNIIREGTSRLMRTGSAPFPRLAKQAAKGHSVADTRQIC